MTPDHGRTSIFSHSTKELFKLTLRYRKIIANKLSVHVRWPAKARGAMAFGLTFLFTKHPERSRRVVKKKSKARKYLNHDLERLK